MNTATTITRAFITLVLALVIAGCANKNLTEEQHYKNLRDGIKYKAYKKVSEESVGPIVDLYNKERRKEGKSEAREEYIHALLGFIWTMTLKPDFAIAETNLALKQANDSKDRYIGLSAQSIAFYEKGWKKLARQQSQQAKHLVSSKQLKNAYEKERAAAYLIVGSLAIKEGDSILAQNSFQELGEITDKPWLPLIAQGASLFTAGSYSEAFRLVKGVSDDKHLSNHEKDAVAKLQAKIKKTVDGGGKFDIGKSVSELAMDTISEKSDASFRKLMESLREYTEKVRV